MTKSIQIEGGTAKIGDFIGFKDDIEATGKLLRIEGNWLVLQLRDDITDETYEAQELASRCWHEGSPQEEERKVYRRTLSDEEINGSAPISDELGEEMGPLPASLVQADAIFASMYSAHRTAGLAKTAALRATAASWNDGRKAFLSAADKYGLNPATAATQWSKGRKG